MNETRILWHRPDRVYDLPKVYFCCAEEDFDLYFDALWGEITSVQNCSLWYRRGDVTDEEAFFDALTEMNLFVIPVTERFLQKGNFALEKEFSFALENGIPVLPLMQAPDLGKRFAESCGSLQYLNRYKADAGSLEYAAKLEQYLSSVLVGDTLAGRIRDAFAGSIFLSYRKKDREKARELMVKIHENDFCRDLAVWYDEFLVPGEEYHDAIENAVMESDLFVLAVTESLTEEGNYVARVEYPLAKRCGKPVLPCQMQPCDGEKLKQTFDGLPPLVCVSEEGELARCLRMHFPDLGDVPSGDPEQNYLMGRAYLNGFRVETDRRRGLELITFAASEGNAEAISKLVDMYTHGDGVEADLGRAVGWQEKLCRVTSDRYGSDPSFATAYAHIRACFSFANALYDLNLFEKSLEAVRDLRDTVFRADREIFCDEDEKFLLHRHGMLAEYLAGRNYHALGELAKAREYYEKAVEICDCLRNTRFDLNHLRDTAILYLYVAQLCKVEGDYRRSLSYLENALQIQTEYAEHYADEGLVEDQISTRQRMSEIRRILFENEEAKRLCLEALEALEELIGLHGIKKYLNRKMSLLQDLADAMRGIPDPAGALEALGRMEELERLSEELTGQVPAAGRVLRLLKEAQIHFQLGNYDKTVLCGEEGLAEIDQTVLSEDFLLATGGTYELSACVLVALSYVYRGGGYSEALDFFRRSCLLAERIETMGILSSVPDLVLFYSTYGDTLQSAGDLESADFCLQKAEKFYREKLEPNLGFRELCTGFSLYLVYGKNRFAHEELPVSEAKEMLERSERICDEILRLRPAHAPTLLRDRSLLTYMLGCCELEENEAMAEEYFSECVFLYEQIPEDRYGLQDWNTLGIALEYLQQLDGSDDREERLWAHCHKMRRLFPDRYRETFLYEMLAEDGFFE